MTDFGDLRRSRALLVAIALVVIAVDQVTKVWAVDRLTGDVIDVAGSLRFRLIRNFGSAFGIGGGLGRWLGLLVIAIVLGVLWWARSMTDRRLLALLGLVVGGAIGNLIDRIVRAEDGILSGGVVDFIDLQWWPVFNVADMAVVVGTAGLALMIWRGQVFADDEHHEQQSGTSADGAPNGLSG